MDNARDVIARAAYEAKPTAHYNRKPAAWDDLPYHGWDGVQADHRQQADAIIAALTAAGFEIVQREEPIQKPEPDWGRRGTQPKGKLGPPPPPNGKRVASKPLPPTPGPFNPFGKQDGED